MRYESDRSTVVDAVEHLNYSLLVYLGLDEGTMIEPWLGTDEMNLPDPSVPDNSSAIEGISKNPVNATPLEEFSTFRPVPEIIATSGNSCLI